MKCGMSVKVFIFQGDEEYTRPSGEGRQNPTGEERESRALSSEAVRKTASRTCVII